MDLATVDELLTTTRAVRRRLDLDRPVPPEVIEECLELAIQAPTGSNMQGWRFLVVTDPEKRKLIADAYRRGWESYATPSREGLEQAEPARAEQSRRVYSSSEHLAHVLDRVPVHVIPCVLGRFPEGVPPGYWASLFGSIFPAVWSFQLALRSRGLGSVLTTLHLFYEQEVGRALGIPETVTQACLLPVAFTKGTDFRPAKRRSAREISYWNSWKEVRA